ncbi:hypothetical protein [Halosimplex salinum]|uniref:hypothetical protein n=1 Tax=Halosimplex salinum TaxID=1710538 RepID=UPI000F487F6B|nr:hypothetical protein [Halosimplex salinum]
MSESETRTAASAADALFDRYTLPKVALAVILTASLVGTWVTTTLNGHASAALAATKWAYFVALGVLTGGLVWKHAFVRPADLDTGSADYCAEMYARFDRIATGALAVLAVGGAVVLAGFRASLGPTPAVYAFVASLVALLPLAAVATRHDGSVEAQFRSPTGLASLALALAVVVATAGAEVAVRSGDPVAVGVRVMHLLAFAAWIGGAVWNIFVAVPAGKRRPTLAVVRAAGEQLERFRWTVRLVIPTLLLTGLYQAVDALGTTVGTYLGSVVGLAVLAKVAAIGLLFVIFLLCPMWRACSPVEGVCDLDDLGWSDPKTERPADSGRPDGSSEVPGDD